MPYEQELIELWSLMMDRGGWTLVALAGMSVLTVATTIVSLIMLVPLRPYSSQSGAAGRLQSLIAGKLRTGCSREAVEEEAMLHAKGSLRTARTGFRLLELIVTAAPLLGLLGTVLGMIDAFQAMQESGDAVKPADLAGGIWEALITTAAGMVIALCALAIHTVLDSIVDQFRFRLERVATAAFNEQTHEQQIDLDANVIPMQVGAE